MNAAPPWKPLRWELNVMLAKRRIKTRTELHRRLRDVGYEISSVQLGRLIDMELPERLNISLLRALMTVLDCDLHDLLVQEDIDYAVASPQSAVTPRTSTRFAAPRSVPEVTAETTGPVVTALPLPDKR